MNMLKLDYGCYHKEFLNMDNEDMYYALIVCVPFSEAKYWKSILWSEFFHLANQFYNLKVTEARMLFNFVVSDLLTDCMTGDVDVSVDDVKGEFLRRSRLRVVEAIHEAKRERRRAANRA